MDKVLVLGTVNIAEGKNIGNISKVLPITAFKITYNDSTIYLVPLGEYMARDTDYIVFDSNGEEFDLSDAEVEQILEKYREIRLVPQPYLNSPELIQAYWGEPWGDDNNSQDYKQPIERSIYLSYIVKKFSDAKDIKICELGCNIGRNLEYLRQAGYNNLTGVDVNGDSLDALEVAYPALAQIMTRKHQLLEEFVASVPDMQYDVVYTMAVLQHLHPSQAGYLADVARITKRMLITIETETEYNWRVFGRDYKTIFEGMGFMQVYSENVSKLFEDSPYMCRVFVRIQNV